MTLNGTIMSIILLGKRRIYLLKQLKHAGIDRKALIEFYCVCIHSVLEYARLSIPACQPICPTK